MKTYNTKRFVFPLVFFSLLLLIILGIVVLILIPRVISQSQENPDEHSQGLVGTLARSITPTYQILTYPTTTPWPAFANSPTPASGHMKKDDTQIIHADATDSDNTNHVSVSQQAQTVTTLPEESFEGQWRSQFSIGHSVEGRELIMHQFGNGEIHRLIIAGIHGGYEYNTTYLADELIVYIEANPQVIPAKVTLYILPSLNPDGLERSHGYPGRANANNVDLNRNWDHNWAQEWNPDGCWQYLPITGGSAPFSEPETQALLKFIIDYQIESVISYHSAGLGIFAGGFPSVSLSEPLAEALAAVSPYPYPPVFTVCEFTGQFTDYLATLNIPAVDIELTNHKETDYEINLLVLKTFLQWSPAE